MVRQLADESYRITQQERRLLIHYFTCGGIQRGKQFILGKHIDLAQQVHDGALAYIGISYQCYPYISAALLSLGSMLAYLFPSGVCAAGIFYPLLYGGRFLFPFHPGPCEPIPPPCRSRCFHIPFRRGKYVLVLRQLYLHFCLCGLWPGGQIYPVSGRCGQWFLHPVLFQYCLSASR